MITNIDLNQSSEPDPFAPFAVKQSNEYGLQISNLIYNDWFNGKPYTRNLKSNYHSRQQYIYENRLFVRAENDIEPYKKHQQRGDNDMDYLNLDWTLLDLVGKFCNNVANGIKDDYYTLDITAMDPTSVKIKRERERQLRRDMISMPLLQKTKETLGIDLMPKGFVAEDEDDIKFKMEMDEKPLIVTSEEILIDYIKKTNGWANFQNMKNKDLVTIGIAGARVWTDGSDGVKMRYIDPEYLIHSNVKFNDFSDMTYAGEIVNISLSDLRRESGFSDNVMRDIAKQYSGNGWFTINDVYNEPMSNILNKRVDILRFCFKTDKKEVYKKTVKKGETTKVSKRDDQYNGFYQTSRTLDTWFEGNFIIGTKYIYGYKECENLARDKMNKAMPPFIIRSVDIYKNELRSFLDPLKPIAREMQNMWLKMQTLTAELKPDETRINWDQLADISGTGDKQANWKQVLSLLNVKNVIIEKTIDLGDEGGIQQGSSARSQAIQQGSALVVLMNRFAAQYNQLYNISGVNPATDGSLGQDALLGVSQLAQLASNTNTKHIVDASVDLDLNISVCISTRIGEIFRSKDAKHIKEIYEGVVGSRAINLREALGDRHLHEFGMVYEMKPTAQEVKRFNEDLQLGIQEGTIDVEEKILADRYAQVNIDRATEYLRYARRKKIKQKQEENERNITLQSQLNMQATQAKAQGDAQLIEIQAQSEIAIYGQKAQIDIMKAKALQDMAQPVEDKEFKQEVYLEQIRSQSSINKEVFKEERKDKRTEIQATQQSKILHQRQKDTAPIDFNGDNDWFLEGDI